MRRSTQAATDTRAAETRCGKCVCRSIAICTDPATTPSNSIVVRKQRSVCEGPRSGVGDDAIVHGDDRHRLDFRQFAHSRGENAEANSVERDQTVRSRAPPTVPQRRCRIAPCARCARLRRSDTTTRRATTPSTAKRPMRATSPANAVSLERRATFDHIGFDVHGVWALAFCADFLAGHLTNGQGVISEIVLVNVSGENKPALMGMLTSTLTGYQVRMLDVGPSGDSRRAESRHADRDSRSKLDRCAERGAACADTRARHGHPLHERVGRRIRSVGVAAGQAALHRDDVGGWSCRGATRRGDGHRRASLSRRRWHQTPVGTPAVERAARTRVRASKFRCAANSPIRGG